MLYRLSVQCDNDDGRDDEVVFQFTADKLLSSGGEVCTYYVTIVNCLIVSYT